MKPSHTTTPRSLADCTFTTGYSSVDLTPRRSRWWPVALTLILAAYIGVLFAWRG